MKERPLVSIIIPVYNAENYLADTITSALDQTWPNKEIIVVNDGSTDGSLSIAKKFEVKGISVYSQINKGASAARNKGLAEAKGTFIQFLDGDDLLSPDKIGRQVETLILNPGKVAVCSTVHFRNGSDHTKAGTYDYEENFLKNDDDPAHFLVSLLGGYSETGSMVQPNAWLTPKAIIDLAGKWNEELSVNDDGEFFCRVLLRSRGIIKTEGLNFYRKYQNSYINLSSPKGNSGLDSMFRSFELKKDHLKSYPDQDAVHNAFYKLYFELLTKSYTGHKSLYYRIREELKTIPKYPIRFVFGGKAVNFIANQVSWKLAKRLQLYFRRYK